MSGNSLPPRIPPRTPPKTQPPATRAEAAPATAPKDAQPSTPSAKPLPKAPQIAQPAIPQGEVSAGAATYYRMTRYVMVVLLVGMGGWFAYDGFIGWPAENQKINDLNHKMEAAKKSGDIKTAEELNANKLTHTVLHSDTDILIQKLLAFGCPALALFMLTWALYQSRGEYRLSGETLYVPGHPPVKLGEITEIDKTLWDRKGIAYISYATAGGQTGRLRLDDFIYERDGTDAIFDRVKAYVTGEPAEPSQGLAT